MLWRIYNINLCNETKAYNARVSHLKIFIGGLGKQNVMHIIKQRTVKFYFHLLHFWHILWLTLKRTAGWTTLYVSVRCMILCMTFKIALNPFVCYGYVLVCSTCFYASFFILSIVLSFYPMFHRLTDKGVYNRLRIKGFISVRIAIKLSMSHVLWRRLFVFFPKSIEILIPFWLINSLSEITSSRRWKFVIVCYLCLFNTHLRSKECGFCVQYLKNSNPSKADVVERDSSLRRVVADSTATGVELVPVDALVGRRRVVHGAVAWSPGHRVWVGWQLRALGHAVIMRLAADEVSVASVVIRRYIQPGHHVHTMFIHSVFTQTKKDLHFAYEKKNKSKLHMTP